MPFQLYPQLPAGYSNEGVVKDQLFADLIEQRSPGMTEEQRRHRADGLVSAWCAEGLCLRSPPTGFNRDGGGRMGSSFDSQRLILLARAQGVEDAMIEEVYAANHTRDECLSDYSVLLGCAERAGVRDAKAALNSGWGMKETLAKIEEYRAMGLTAVPVVFVDSFNGTPIKSVLSSGAPETDFLREALRHVVQTGKLPWQDSGRPLPPPAQQLPSPQPKINWTPQLAGASPQAAPSPSAAPSSRTGGASMGVARAKGEEKGEVGSAHARVLQMLGGGETGSGKATAGETASTTAVTEAGSRDSDRSALPQKGACADVTGAVTNVLAGSKRKSRSRPHAMFIDADFVTCTQ